LEDVLELLKSQVEGAKKDLSDLEKLIELAKEVGEDTTEAEMKKKELEAQLRKWEEALSKRLSK